VILRHPSFPRIAVLILLLAALVVPAASAQDSTSPVTARLGPFNDYFLGAEPVQFYEDGGVVLNWESNVGATTEAGEPGHCGTAPIGATVWYKLVVTVPTLVYVATDNTPSGLDSILSVYTGSAVGSLTPVICNDDISVSNYASEVEFIAQPGVSYWVQVGGYDGQQGVFHLEFDYTTTRPANDDFVDAWALLGSRTQHTGGATIEAGEPDHCGMHPIGATVWYYAEFAEPMFVAVDTRGSEFDTVLAVYTGGSVGSLTQVVCNDDISDPDDLDSEVEFTAQPDVLYRIQVGGYNGDTGNLQIHLSWDYAGYFCRGRPATHVGTAGNDVIHGTGGNDVIVALGGNDIIYGYGGKDFICAGAGRDTVYAGPGNDRVLGDAGYDQLHGQAGNDRIFGRAGDDVIFGELGDDRLRGNSGYDTLRGDAGFDTCRQGEDVICEVVIG
jgi:hypothetical protein